jgi:hypothetical protein
MDGPPSVFFLSHAHHATRERIGVPLEPTRWVDKFFDGLSETVAELVGPGAGADVGFMDRSLQSGDIWSDEWLWAVGTCQVCIALLSPSYLGRKWCAMEWSAFAQRRVIRRSDHKVVSRKPIIPVKWTPIRVGYRFPAAIMKVQHFRSTGLPDPTYGSLYESEGIEGLMRIGSPAYETTVWKLAKAVSTFCETYWVEPQTFRQADLRNIFHGGVRAE